MELEEVEDVTLFEAMTSASSDGDIEGFCNPTVGWVGLLRGIAGSGIASIGIVGRVESTESPNLAIQPGCWQ